jgi:hypothetical protein
MAKFETVKAGEIALIQVQEDGSISQIGLTKQQSQMLNFFMATLSKEQSLLKMPSDYDLVLKSSICDKCKTK